MGFTRARRYANHNSGRKYKKGTREILPQEEDHMTSKYAESQEYSNMSETLLQNLRIMLE